MDAGDHKPQIYKTPAPLGGMTQGCNFVVQIIDSPESVT